MRHKREGCGRACDRPHDACGNRDTPHKLDALPPQIAAGQAHVSSSLVRLGAMPYTFNQLYVWDTVLRGKRLSELARVLAHIVRAATGYGEVVTTDSHRATVNLSESHHVSAGGELYQVAIVIELGRANHRSRFEEAARVNHLFNTFAHSVSPTAVLPLHTLRSTEFRGEATHILHVFNGVFPRHAGLPTLAVFVYWHLLPPCPSVLGLSLSVGITWSGQLQRYARLFAQRGKLSISPVVYLPAAKSG